MATDKTLRNMMMHEGVSRAAVGGHRWTDANQFPAISDNVRAVQSTPYAIFVHNSPIYRTCKLVAPRIGRPARRTAPRRKRLLPYRPDGYPFANERWSRRYRRENAIAVEETDG